MSNVIELLQYILEQSDKLYVYYKANLLIQIQLHKMVFSSRYYNADDMCFSKGGVHL